MPVLSEKRDHQKFVGGFALSDLLGSGSASVLPLGTLSLGLWVIVVVIYEGLYFNLAQGQMNGAPNETRTHSCRFASRVC